MRRLILAIGSACFVALTAAAQDKPKQFTNPSTGQAVTLPSPGPEHQVLKSDEGIWDATIQMRMQPNAEPEVSKGVEVRQLLNGGLWLIRDFKGDLMGSPYYGHMINGYDPQKKLYVGTWVDSMSAGLTQVESTYDSKTKTFNCKLEGPCPDGTIQKFRATDERKDPNTQVFTMYAPPSTGEEFAAMTITYKRRISK